MHQQQLYMYTVKPHEPGVRTLEWVLDLVAGHHAWPCILYHVAITNLVIHVYHIRLTGICVLRVLELNFATCTWKWYGVDTLLVISESTLYFALFCT